MKGKKTKEQFVSDARKVHGNKYDYSKVEYKGCHVEVEVVCPKHGSFWQTPTNHLLGHGCIKCRTEERANRQRRTTDEFIAQARIVHGDKYNYDKTEYVNKRTNVCITCPIHGDFWQNAQSHLNGCGCKECMKEKFRLSYEEFILRAKAIHNCKYDYSLITKINFNGFNSIVDIICTKHGVFKQKAGNHINGKGCKKCAYEKLREIKSCTLNEFIKNAKQVHGNKYDYSKVEYINRVSSVCIICQTHGEFWQRADHHLNGVGCPSCKHSYGEEFIEKYLNEKGIHYIRQYKIPNEYLFCKNKRLYVDFYLPKHNIFIEFNGAQHYKPIEYFGGKQSFERQIERDNALKKYCIDHKVKLIEIPYTEIDNINKILNKKIKNYKTN